MNTKLIASKDLTKKHNATKNPHQMQVEFNSQFQQL